MVRRKDKEKTTTSTTTIKIRTQTSWVSADMDDGINEHGPAVSVSTNMYILIIVSRGEDVISIKKKTSNIIWFYVVKSGKKSSNGPPFGSFSREK